MSSISTSEGILLSNYYRDCFNKTNNESSKLLASTTLPNKYEFQCKLYFDERPQLLGKSSLTNGNKFTSCLQNIDRNESVSPPYAISPVNHLKSKSQSLCETSTNTCPAMVQQQHVSPVPPSIVPRELPTHLRNDKLEQIPRHPSCPAANVASMHEFWKSVEEPFRQMDDDEYQLFHQMISEFELMEKSCIIDDTEELPPIEDFDWEDVVFSPDNIDLTAYSYSWNSDSKTVSSRKRNRPYRDVLDERNFIMMYNSVYRDDFPRSFQTGYNFDTLLNMSSSELIEENNGKSSLRNPCMPKKGKTSQQHLQQHTLFSKDLIPTLNVDTQHPASWGVGNRKVFHEYCQESKKVSVEIVHPACLSSTIAGEPKPSTLQSRADVFLVEEDNARDALGRQLPKISNHFKCLENKVQNEYTLRQLNKRTSALENKALHFLQYCQDKKISLPSRSENYKVQSAFILVSKKSNDGQKFVTEPTRVVNGSLLEIWCDNIWSVGEVHNIERCGNDTLLQIIFPGTPQSEQLAVYKDKQIKAALLGTYVPKFIINGVLTLRNKKALNA